MLKDNTKMLVQTYLYNNKVVVNLVDPTNFITRNKVVYATPITIYQGIDNPIQVLVKNQDQKAINLTGYAVQAEIQDPNSKSTIESFAVAWANITLGQGTFTISKATVNSLEQRYYTLTFKTVHVASNSERPMYIDDNYGVPLDLRVLPAYYALTEPSPTVDNSVIDGGVI